MLLMSIEIPGSYRKLNKHQHEQFYTSVGMQYFYV